VGIFLEGEDSRDDRGLGRFVDFRFKAPPGTASSSITTHTPSGQRNCASWASQPQKSVTLLPCPGGRTTKSTKGHVVALEKKNILMKNQWVVRRHVLMVVQVLIYIYFGCDISCATKYQCVWHWFCRLHYMLENSWPSVVSYLPTDVPLQWGGSVTRTLNIRLQNTRIPKEIFAASNKEERRKLAHHQQRLGSKISTRIFKIYEIGRFL